MVQILLISIAITIILLHCIMWRHLKYFYANPFYQILPTIGLFISGAYASIYSESIGETLSYALPCEGKENVINLCPVGDYFNYLIINFVHLGAEDFPFSKKIPDMTFFKFHEFFSNHVEAFVLLVIFSITILLFLLGRFAARSVSKEVNDQFMNKAEELSNQIRTMPPASFLETFDVGYRDCYQAFNALNKMKDKSLSKEIIEKGIRVILKGIADICETYDGERAVYGVNIMVFENKKEKFGKVVFVDEQFINKGIIHDGFYGTLKGVLRLIPELSTKSNAQAFELDNSLENISLPVPVISHSGDGKWYSLPGAPVAYEEQSPNRFTNVDKIPAWMKKNNFNSGIIGKVEEYFSGNKAVRSFISIPIPFNNRGFEEENSKCPVVAVLNIHRDKIGLFKEQKKLDPFLYFLPPFLGMVEVLLEKWSRWDSN